MSLWPDVETATEFLLRTSSLGVNEDAPATVGTVAVTMGANGATGIRVKRFQDSAPTGYFAEFYNAAGTTRLSGIRAVDGAFVGPVHDMGGQWYNATLDYGGAATGVLTTNTRAANTTAFNALVAHIQATAPLGKGTIVFPAGLFPLNIDLLEISGISLRGVGHQATQIQAATTNDYAVKYRSATSPNINSFTIQDLYFFGSVRFANAGYGTVVNCRIDGMLDLQGQAGMDFTNVQAYGETACQIGTEGGFTGAGTTTFSGCLMGNGGTAKCLTMANNAQVTFIETQFSNSIGGVNQAAISVDSGAMLTLIDCHTESTVSSDSLGCAIELGKTSPALALTIIGGTYYGHGDGGPLVRDFVRVWAATLVRVNGARIGLSSNGFTRAAFRFEATANAAGDQVDTRGNSYSIAGVEYSDASSRLPNLPSPWTTGSIILGPALAVVGPTGATEAFRVRAPTYGDISFGGGIALSSGRPTMLSTGSLLIAASPGGAVSLGVTAVDNLLVNAAGDLVLTHTQDAYSPATLVNASAGNAAIAAWQVSNDAGQGLFGVAGSGYTTLPIRQNRAFVDASAGLDGILLNAQGADPIVFATSSTERARVLLGLMVGTAIDPGVGGFAATGAVLISGTLTPAALSGDVNDYNPTGASTALTLRIDGSAADRNITGLAAGTPADGRIITITNVGATNALILKNQSASSAAANRFLLPADTTLPPDTAIALRYDGTSARWRPWSRALANSGVTAGTYGSATQVSQIVVDVAGRVTAVSGVTITPAVGSVTGLGAGVATFLATPSSVNLLAAVTDETGTGALVFGTAPTIAGGTHTALTSLGIRDTGAAFDLTIAATGTGTSAGRTLTLDVVNAARTIKLGGNLTLAADLITSGAFSLTLTQTGATNVTLPTTGTLATLSGSAVTNISPAANFTVTQNAVAHVTFVNSGAKVDTLVVDTGRVGIGTAAFDAWGSTNSVLYVGRDATISALTAGGSGPTLRSASNLYFDGSNWRYIETAPGTVYNGNGSNGTHTFFTAASGTAGNIATLISAMTIGITGGVYDPGATGSDKGLGTINWRTYYGNGTAGVTQTSAAVTALATIGGIVTTFTPVSDIDLKDWSTFPHGLADLRRLLAIRFTWNSIALDHDPFLAQFGEMYGFAAQNVRAVAPELVGVERWEDGREWLTLRSDRAFTAWNTNAIIELDDKVDREVDAIRTEIAALTRRLGELESRRN